MNKNSALRKAVLDNANCRASFCLQIILFCGVRISCYAGSMQNISELRRDIVSGDWVVIATGRARRPNEFAKAKPPLFTQPKISCPFEKLHSDALLVHSDGDNRKNSPTFAKATEGKWWVQAIPNKYPAFGKGICDLSHKVGPYQWTEGVGFHEVVVTRDHNRSIAQMTDREAELLVQAYHDRYVALKDGACVRYISIFHNHGRNSGASISHPHSQIIAIPVIPPDVGHSLKGSAEYYHKHKACVHCVMLGYELKAKARLIYQNNGFVALAPFASKTAFEIRIFPKGHYAQFETLGDKGRRAFANTLRVTLAKLYRGLKNPDYNYFIHTAPVDPIRNNSSNRASVKKEYEHYHWHLEILPKTAIWAGFEIGTGIEISTIAPETASQFLRRIKV